MAWSVWRSSILKTEVFVEVACRACFTCGKVGGWKGREGAEFRPCQVGKFLSLMQKPFQNALGLAGGAIGRSFGVWNWSPPSRAAVRPRRRKRPASLGSAGAWGRRADRASGCCEPSYEGDVCLGAGTFCANPPNLYSVAFRDGI